MLANIDLTDSERRMLLALNDEEREVVIDQMLEKVREELQWLIAVDRARKLAAGTALVATVDPPTAPTRPTPPPVPRRSSTPPMPRFHWSSGPRRATR